MRRMIIMLLITVAAQAQESTVTGKVTYVSSGTVYVSAGRGTGLRDSMLVYVVAGKDTVATMKIFAVSSKSSACTILRSKREVVVGDNVVGRVKQDGNRVVVGRTVDSTASVKVEVSESKPSRPVDNPAVSLMGRVSFQYYTTTAPTI
jgi:hypothetical protein